MQIIGLHKNIYKLSSYTLPQGKLEILKRLVLSFIYNSLFSLPNDLNGMVALREAIEFLEKSFTHEKISLLILFRGCASISLSHSINIITIDLILT